MTTVSIVSPSFNQIRYVADTLKSVVGQSVEPCEHIIFDPGSTDGTIELLREYESRTPFARLRIGVDSGQANAINVGFREASGDILCWLNTDDQYIDSAVLSDVIDAFEAEPEVDVVYGRGEFVGSDGEFLREVYINTPGDQLKNRFIHSCGILQPALFMRRSVFERFGSFDENLTCAFDYEYWIRIAVGGARFRFIDRKLARVAWHDDAKTSKLRGQSFEESVEACRRHYGFAPIEWIERLAGWRLSGENFVIQNADKASEASLAERKRLASEMFATYNGGDEAARPISAILRWAGTGDAARNVDMAKRLILQQTRAAERSPSGGDVRSGTGSGSEPRFPVGAKEFAPEPAGATSLTWIVTAFDNAYFSLGVTLLSGLFKNGYARTPKLVFDLGLTTSQIGFLRSLENVYVIQLGGDAYGLPEWYFKPKNYVFKLLSMEQTRRLAGPNDIVLWIDAGVYPIGNLAEITSLIRTEGAFFIDHDDRANWPFYNIAFTSDACVRAAQASLDELLAPHICSCLMGFRNGSGFEHLFEEAFALSRNPEASLGEKHPEIPERIASKHRSEVEAVRQRLLSQPREALDIQQLRGTFGYGGHRQDQSILSLLVARTGAPVYSALAFCPGSDASSEASRMNHLSGGLSKEVQADPFGDEAFPDSVTIHHRGTFVSFDHLRFRQSHKREAIILGNGPSLKGFDFSRLGRFDVFGMNVAYRHWYEINWFPQHYACLDKVVGIHHKDAIAKLIEDAENLGIQSFLLRAGLIEAMGDIGLSPRVVDFDALRYGFSGFRAEPITTGSHTCAWASMLGYRDIYLLGVDCNYVSMVDGAEARGGTVLEIVEEKENPNYFFAGYQQAGDRYNIPDSSKDLHIRSWRSVGAAIDPARSRVINANLESKVDAFPFVSFDDVERGGLVPVIPADAVLAGDTSSKGRSRIIVPSPEPIFETSEFDRKDTAQIDECRVVFEILKRNAKPGVMIDVGAHFGGSLRRFANENWTVFAFEPDPKNRARLLTTLNGRSNVVLSEEAVSDVSGKVVALYASEESSGISGLTAFHESHREVAKVKTVTLRDVIARHGIAAIDFLKIDVEGLEMAVLRGMDFAKLSPEVVLVEFEDTKTFGQGYDVHDLGHFFTERGYTVYISEWYPIERYGISHSFRRFRRYPNDIPADSWGNLVAFRTDPAIDVMEKVVRAATTLPRADTAPPEAAGKKDDGKAARPATPSPLAAVPAASRPSPVTPLAAAAPKRRAGCQSVYDAAGNVLFEGQWEPREILAALTGFDWRSKRVLDIGANTAGLSLELARQGADVVALEPDPDLTNRAHTVELVERMSIEEKLSLRYERAGLFDANNYGHFDIVLCLGLIYHFRDPQYIIDFLSTLDHTHLIISTQTASGEDLHLINRRGVSMPAGFWSDDVILSGWHPTRPLLERMLRWAGFENVVALTDPSVNFPRKPMKGLTNSAYYRATKVRSTDPEASRRAYYPR